MGRSGTASGGPSSFLELESDLPSLASQAAVELDNLSLGRGKNLSAVKTLAEKLSQSVTEVDEPSSRSSLLDPVAAVAVSRAIGDLGDSAQPKQLNDLLSRAGDLTRQLRALAEDATADADIPTLRSFCVALSRHASAAEPSLYDRYSHPYRQSL